MMTLKWEKGKGWFKVAEPPTLKWEKGKGWFKVAEPPTSEFRTSAEAEDRLRSLHRAAGYCQGPESSRQHSERIAQVQAEAKKLRKEGK